ncbi:MAG: peptide deformylase [Erysipelotrichaceae bacterium]|nr:peptide deformylase [Erysipelotrichaceae bacterium]MBR2701131.1 peptide deformylase [Erysipelotrichaceae bacterium]MBR2746155.1 peptide deformylase [Erysipelotrichaceae bacterium]
MRITASDIVMDGEQVLREKAVDVELPLSKKDKQTLTDMITYVRNSRDEEYREKYNVKASVGIAAPQIGISRKLLAVSIEDEDDCVEFALANPKIISNSTQKAYLENGESCLSVSPDVEGIVPRYARITVRAYNMLTDRLENIRLTGYPAIVLQHEIDHLYGHLYYDHINKNDPWAPIPDAVII